VSGDRLHGGIRLEDVEGHPGTYVLRFSRVRGAASPQDVTAGLYEPDLEELKAVLGSVTPGPAAVIDFLQGLLAGRLRIEKSFGGDSVREMRASHKTQAVREVIEMLQQGGR
jgi:hypothetical protein